MAGSEARVELLPVLESLASEYHCNDILVEAGPTLCGAFLRTRLVDELIVYVAPKLMGDDGKAFWICMVFKPWQIPRRLKS